MRTPLAALGSGLLFGIGLCVSGMTDPANIIAFLDVSGRWSPNLAGVMLGAVAVHFSWLRWVARRDSALDAAPAEPLQCAARNVSDKRIDGALVSGAALFGIGWGLAGYCPGPAIVGLGSGALGTIAFVLAMAAGMLLNDGARWTIKRFGKASTPAR